MTSDPLHRFSALTREWFTGTFAAPTTAQAQAWNAIADGDNTLVIAPTGSGKTLAAFLWALDSLRGLRREAGRHPRSVRDPTQGAGRRRRTQPAHAAGGAHPDRRTPRPADPRHQRRGPLRRHPARAAPAA